MKENARLLIVDDEAGIREILEFNLKNEGFEIETASSAEEALEKLSPEYDLIVLDVMMGGMSGFRMAEKLRRDGNLVPIIFLTAKDTENDMLTGFSTGGDDYVSKPFSIKELIARVKAVLKRTQTQTDDAYGDVLSVESLSVNIKTKQLTIDGQNVILTRTEFEILHLLLSHPKRIFTREEILNRVWKDDVYVLERTVDVHVTRLRKKMKEYGRLILNRSGYGYCFDDAAKKTKEN